MTEQEVMDWIESYLSSTKAETSAKGMIKADVAEFGFDGWLHMLPENVVSSYLDVTEEISQELVDSFTTLFSQEKDLQELGIEQSMRRDPSECVSAMRNGMTDIMRSLFHYVETQRMAHIMIYQPDED